LNIWGHIGLRSKFATGYNVHAIVFQTILVFPQVMLGDPIARCTSIECILVVCRIIDCFQTVFA
jgi:hypothetical protein